jgi:IPT/TIG domain
VLASSCIARPEGKFQKPTDDDAGTPGPINLDGGNASDVKGELPPTDAHAVLGVDPPHGPWNGGQTVIVRGNGFTSQARIWFGTDEIPAADLVPVDSERVQVVVPPGSAGPVDVSAQDGDDASTRRTLLGGYEYDRFYADPKSGPTSGGTIVTLHGQGTSWNDKTEAFIDLVACSDVKTLGPTELSCTAPASTPGTKPMRVTTEDGVSVDVLDAFTYGDSDNGFKGGLSGNTLVDHLKVIALDSFTGDVLSTATAVVGDDLATALVQQTDGSGVTLFQAPNLGPKRTVTVTKKCYQPITLVDVPVDTVTVYLDAVLSPQCIEDGDPPPVGGTPALGSAIIGELVWKSGKEFQTRPGWTNVPPTKSPDERLAAYVFELGTDPTTAFQLPNAGDAVTPDSPGSLGYSYVMSAGTGNLGLYAVAGIENRVANPPYFKAYAMGIAKGVAAQPGQQTIAVYINMDIPLDHGVTLSLTGPTPTAKGPDRVRAHVAIQVGELGYALLPAGSQEKLLPVGSPLSFVGIPPLVGGISDGLYVVSAAAVTGATGSAPRSIAQALATNSTAGGVSLDQFVQIPTLSIPAATGVWSGAELQWGAPVGGASVQLSVLSAQSAGGLKSWTVVAPEGVTETKLPDLAALSSDFALFPGAITISITRAHIEAFDYGSLRYRQLDKRGWNAYAQDVFFSYL